MKKLSLAGLIAMLVALVLFFATGCTVKETKIVEATTTTSEATTTTAKPVPTTSGRQPQKLSVSAAIATAQDTAPSLYIYTDSEMIQLMQVACDSLDQWGGDYDAFLLNAQNQMAGESSQMINETSALVVAGVYSLCTEHQIGLIDAMNSMNGF